jgi:uncharacterized cupin superfamily protein
VQKTVVDGVAMWSVWQQDRGLYFNAYYVEAPDGNLLIDPLALDDADAAEIEQRGGVAWFAITTRDHERETAAAAVRFGAKIAAGAPDVPSLGVAADRELLDGETICGARVLALEGLKSPGEFALHLRDRGAVVVGDALWGVPAGALSMMDDRKLQDPVAAALSLRALRKMRPRHVLTGDGAPVFERGFEALNACLDARDAHVNVVNLDSLTRHDDRIYPSPFGSRAEEIGFMLGATKLGYWLGVLPPGSAFCPLHWHTREEELFVVWEGHPTLRGPRGDVRLRRGDVVAFPTGPRGAHKLLNETGEPCSVLMISNADPGDVCFYPDSDKLLVDSTGLIVRSSPDLDYFHGEAGEA